MRKLFNKPWFVAVMVGGALLLVGYKFLGNSSAVSGNFDALADENGLMGGAEGALAPDTFAALPMPTAVADPFAVRIRPETEGEESKVVVPDIVDTVHLSAIWSQGEKVFVLLNDRIYQAGDEIGRITIESATQDGVWVTHWKGRDFLAFGRDFTLRTPGVNQPAVAANL